MELGMNLDFSQIVPSMPYILKGIGVTIQIVLASAILGFVLGVILSLCKISRNKPLQWFADAYTSVFRGTPLVLQLLLIYFDYLSCSGLILPRFQRPLLRSG